ncbi:MAG TPA: PAS domain S-box protein [Candidatus Acidoferrales bacterium]|nr:PAS domain S-box protein [Candidatus Acidoferrales bacterium]
MSIYSKAGRHAFEVALAYAIIACCWILTTDQLVRWLVHSADARVVIGIVKDLAFVLASCGCLYVALRRLLQRCEHEVQQRQQIEAALSDNAEKLYWSEEHLRLIFEASHDGLWDWNIVTGEDHFSPRWKKILGYRDHELPNLKSTFIDLLHPDDRALVEKTTTAHLEKGERYEVEFRLRHKNGSWRWVSSRGAVIRDASGRPIRMVGAISDVTERKQAEATLRDSEERYRQLFELESDAVILVDRETHRVVDVNESAQRLYGYSREEFLGLTIEAVSAEPDKTRARVDSEAHQFPLCWHRKKSHERIAVEVNCNQIVHRGRRMLLATLRDITARQEATDRLRETTEQLLEAQEVAGLGSYAFDVATGSWTGSAVLGDIFGLADPGVARDITDWLQLIHPEDRPDLLRYLQDDVLTKHASFNRVYRIVRVSDQRVRWVHGRGKITLGEHGQAARLVGVIQDITERKRAEDQINVQLSALSAAANAIVITDAGGEIEWVNPAFSTLTGFTAAEAIGNTPRMLKSGRQPLAFYANLWTTILAGNAWQGEITNRCKDGRLYTESMTITPVRGADGRIAHFVAIKQDVTEQRQLQQRIQQAQKLEAIGTLAGGIAHDFNNILASMLGYASLLQQDTEGQPSAQEDVGEIVKATQRARDLVQQILTFSRQREQKLEIIQLGTVIKEAIKFLRASLPAQIRIDLMLAPDMPPVLADPTQIYQVIINLATNALHAMEGRAGQLAVSLSPFQPDDSFIQSHPGTQRQTYAHLTVADTGSGMDAKTLERIFEPFFTTKPVGKGTGLGLAMVHGIVQAHNGLMTVYSEVGRGTTFHLYFPGRTMENTVPLEQESTAPAGHGERILVLDDEPALTSTLQRTLTRLNYTVATSNSARDAVGRLRENPGQYDLVVTDLTMPEMNGLEVARQLRALRPELPVILTSGFSADSTQEDLRASGICELLQKPVSRNVLAEAIQRALASRSK